MAQTKHMNMLLQIVLLVGLVSVDAKLIEEMQCSSFQSDAQFIKTSVQIEHIEKQMRALEEEMNSWEERIVSSLTDAEETVKDEMAALETEVDRTLDERNATVELTLSTTRDNIGKITEKFDDYQQRLNSTTRSMIEQHQVTINAWTDKSTAVAFKARTPKTNSNNDETVPFYHTLTNIGHAYNNETGIFTAPVDGVYLFTLQISTTSSQWFFAEIVVNNKTVVGQVLQADVHCKWVSNAGEGLTSLTAGDTVAVRRVDGSIISIVAIYDDDAHWSSFSGVLIHAT